MYTPGELTYPTQKKVMFPPTTMPGGWCSTWTTIDFSTSTVENTMIGASIRPAVFCLLFLFFASLEDKDSKERLFREKQGQLEGSVQHVSWSSLFELYYLSSIYIDKIANLACLKAALSAEVQLFVVTTQRGFLLLRRKGTSKLNKSPTCEAPNFKTMDWY